MTEKVRTDLRHRLEYVKPLALKMALTTTHRDPTGTPDPTRYHTRLGGHQRTGGP